MCTCAVHVHTCTVHVCTCAVHAYRMHTACILHACACGARLEGEYDDRALCMYTACILHAYCMCMHVHVALASKESTMMFKMFRHGGTASTHHR